ncbi:MAG: thiamine pyrophosphate-dependent enzyme [Alphaproteobacteria bacterium]|nr:thiamine pyrophosphate-dependent enzyme [Alphaproteobacteria bacterium]
MSENKMTFVAWLAQRLAQRGMRHAFGVPGGGTSLDLLAALRDQNIETVITAREDAAMIMAGVSGVLTEGPGLAFTTKGPGLASATNGLASAALDRMPALLMSESFTAPELEFLSHQVFAQSELVAPLLRQGQGLELQAEQGDVETWLNLDHMAPAVMFSGTADLNKSVPADYAHETDGNDTPDLAPALSLLSISKRPVIVVGLEAARVGLTPTLRAFVDALGAPVLCTYMAKGCIADDDPHFAGLFTGGAIEQTCVEAADLIIMVGLDPVELLRKPWSFTAPVLDLCERAYDPHYLQPAGRITAPLAVTLAALTNDLTTSEWSLDDIAGFRDGFLNGMATDATDNGSGLSSTAVVKAASDAFTQHPRLSVDAGAHMFSACAFWPGKAPRDVLISNGLASMAFAVPAAIAAALHEPERGAVAITGDGGLLMCLGEFKTAVETKANITIIVFNDGRLSLIDIKREDRQMADLGLSWTPPDFADIARGFGFTAWQVNGEDELVPALQQAASASGPRLVDIRIDASGYREQLRALRG